MTRYLYDWADLPIVPESDGEFPYHVIVYSKDENQYALMKLSNPFVVRSSTICFPLESTWEAFLCTSSSTNWMNTTMTVTEGATAPYVKPPEGYTFVWTNHDLIDENGYVIYDAMEVTSYEFTPPAPEITECGEDATYIHGHDAASLICRATLSDYRGGLIFRWYRDGIRVSSNAKCTPNTNELGNFTYYCEVSNHQFGESTPVQSNPITITVKEKDFCPISFSAGMALGADLAGWDIAGTYDAVAAGTRAYLYNGVKLPELPASPSGYGNAYVCYSKHVLDSLTGYYVWFADQPFYAGQLWSSEDDTRIICTHGKAYNYVKYKLVDGSWKYDGKSNTSGSDLTLQILWANVDVYVMNHNAEDSSIFEPTDTLYLSASEPQPVYM